ncbi:MAG: bile acid:sodium symporter [Pyrodictiaceae archaeon]
MSGIVRVAEHLRKYLLLYVVLVIAIAIPVGYYYASFFKTHTSLMKTVILSLAIATLYPSMVQLRAEKLGPEVRAKPREITLGIILVFLVGPLMAMLLAGTMGNKLIGIGFVAANVVPASSASIAYVLLADGNVELATVLAILSIIGAIILAPVYVSLYAATVSVSLPITVLAESVALALVTPFVLGQLTRYFLVKRRARKMILDNRISLPCKERLSSHVSGKDALRYQEEAIKCAENRISKSLKPYLSLATMLFMLALIFMLIANKSILLVEKPMIAANIIGSQLVIYSTTILILLATSKAMKMRYEDHMGIAFITITKNESVAAAMTVMAIGTTAALPAALIPAVQPVVAILYIALALVVRRIIGQPEAKSTLKAPTIG